MVARELGMTPGEVERIRHAAVMHDVGKIGIPDDILLKPGRLDESEFAIMRTHATIGGRLLADSGSDVMETGRVIALSHHERWNGTGYPSGLAREEIPIEGRICAAVDVFDAMTSARPYRSPLPNEEVFEMLRDGAGELYDPTVVEAFVDLREAVEEVQARHRGDVELLGRADPGAAEP